jgi:hypothetical protein
MQLNGSHNFKVFSESTSGSTSPVPGLRTYIIASLGAEGTASNWWMDAATVDWVGNVPVSDYFTTIGAGSTGVVTASDRMLCTVSGAQNLVVASGTGTASLLSQGPTGRPVLVNSPTGGSYLDMTQGGLDMPNTFVVPAVGGFTRFNITVFGAIRINNAGGGGILWQADGTRVFNLESGPVPPSTCAPVLPGNSLGQCTGFWFPSISLSGTSARVYTHGRRIPVPLGTGVRQRDAYLPLQVWRTGEWAAMCFRFAGTVSSYGNRQRMAQGLNSFNSTTCSSIRKWFISPDRPLKHLVIYRQQLGDGNIDRLFHIFNKQMASISPAAPFPSFDLRIYDNFIGTANTPLPSHTFVSAVVPVLGPGGCLTTSASVNYECGQAINPATLKTGPAEFNSWRTASNQQRRQKFNIDFGGPVVINRITIENYHNTGADTNMGIKEIEIWSTSSGVAFANTAYINLTSLTLVYSTTVPTHTGANISDPFIIDLPAPFTTQYMIIRVLNNHGHPNFTGFRTIDFQEGVNDDGTTNWSTFDVCDLLTPTIITDQEGMQIDGTDSAIGLGNRILTNQTIDTPSPSTGLYGCYPLNASVFQLTDPGTGLAVNGARVLMISDYAATNGISTDGFIMARTDPAGAAVTKGYYTMGSNMLSGANAPGVGDRACRAAIWEVVESVNGIPPIVVGGTGCSRFDIKSSAGSSTAHTMISPGVVPLTASYDAQQARGTVNVTGGFVSGSGNQASTGVAVADSTMTEHSTDGSGFGITTCGATGDSRFTNFRLFLVD